MPNNNINDEKPKDLEKLEENSSITPQVNELESNGNNAYCNTECTFNKEKDEKCKKIFSYASIPFFLAGVVLAMFKIEGKARNPYSILLILVAIVIFAIPYAVRFFDLKKCSCQVCSDHRKVTLQFLTLFAVLICALLALFIYFIVA